MLHPRVLQNFTRGQAVAAPQDQHAPGIGHAAQHRPHQRFVIAIFIARRKLQIAVEPQPHVIALPGQDNALVGCGPGVDHRLLIVANLGPALHAVSQHQSCDQAAAHQQRGSHVRTDPALPPQCNEQCQRDRHIGQPEHQSGADHPQMRHQHQREQQRGNQRPDIVIGQHVRDQFTKGETMAQDADQQRDFQPDQHPDHQHQRIEHHAKIAHQRKQQEQPRRRPAAQCSDQDFHPHEHAHLIAADMARKPAANAHREQIAADHRGKLGDAVAQEIACQRARQKLVDQPARRHDKDRDQQDDRQRSGGLPALLRFVRHVVVSHARRRR